MLGKSRKNTSPITEMNSSPSGATNSLVAGTRVEGKIEASNDIRIDGRLEGTLNCKGKVIIGPQGVIEGDVVCVQAVIEGTFKGNLKVSEILNVRETARISGDIVTEKLLVQSGAIFNVTCNMGGQKIKPLSENAKAAK